jgi:hypothetical protein
MNANTIVRVDGANSPAQGPNVIPAYAPTTTSAAVVLNQQGNPAILTVATGALISGPTAATTTGVVGANFDGHPFKVRLVGKITTGASCNVTTAIQLVLSPATTISSSNNIATQTSIAVNTTSANFFLEATVLWDNITQKVQGYQTGHINNSLLAVAALSNAASVTTQGALQFIPILTVSNTTSCTISITEFMAETV